MYDVGANNIKLGRDRKMAWAREVVLAWKAAVNRQTPPVLGTFLPDFVIRTFPHYYRENREFMYAVFNKMSFMQSVSLNYSTTRDTVARFMLLWPTFPIEEKTKGQDKYARREERIFFPFFIFQVNWMCLRGIKYSNGL